METYYSNRGLPYLGDDSTKLSLNQLCSGLRMRSTSWPFDERICLAILLRLNVATIVATEHTKKTAAFWRRIGSVPRHLAFSNAHELTQKGYRWAPASFMGGLDTSERQGPRDQADEALTKITPDGLVFQSSALFFKSFYSNASVFKA